jgi:hypothetical protein
MNESEQLRIMALQLAIQQYPGDSAEETVIAAEKFFEFLQG